MKSNSYTGSKNKIPTPKKSPHISVTKNTKHSTEKVSTNHSCKTKG